jgi:predicted  nucleic acid-binding Zn-ribbon protein
MRRLHRELLLVLALVFLSKCHCEEEADELSRVKTTLRECRSDLNNLEVAKDRCSEAQKELKNRIKELENKISDLDAHGHLLRVRYYITRYAMRINVFKQAHSYFIKS